jgi:MFS family permease
MVGGRMLNRMGPRALILIGFALMGLGYAAVAVTSFGLAGFLVATLPAGLGLGAIVGGALRTIALVEAPAEQRSTGQGLINIFNGIGVLLSAAAVSAIADYRGGGAAGFTTAYLLVAVMMGIMLVIATALRKGDSLHRRAERLSRVS